MSRQSDLERTRRGTHIADDSPATPEVDASLGDDHAAGNNLAKIRDILFGAQVRDHERRFTKLEAQLLAEAAQLRTDLKDRFASLEQYIRNEVETLIGRLSREEQSRTSAVDLLAGELQRLAATLQQTADLSMHRPSRETKPCGTNLTVGAPRLPMISERSMRSCRLPSMRPSGSSRRKRRIARPSRHSSRRSRSGFPMSSLPRVHRTLFLPTRRRSHDGGVVT